MHHCYGNYQIIIQFQQNLNVLPMGPHGPQEAPDGPQWTPNGPYYGRYTMVLQNSLEVDFAQKQQQQDDDEMTTKKITVL